MLGFEFNGDAMGDCFGSWRENGESGFGGSGKVGRPKGVSSLDTGRKLYCGRSSRYLDKAVLLVKEEEGEGSIF